MANIRSTMPGNRCDEAICGDIFNACDFWRDQNNIPYATIRYGDYFGDYPIDSERFSSFVSDVYFDGNTKIIKSETLKRIVHFCRVEAMTRGKKYTSFYRIGRYGNAIYVDIGDSSYSAYEITSEGWSKIENPPCKFTRSPQILPLPEADYDGQIEDIFKIINIKNERDRLLVMGWLLSAFRPGDVYPILKFYGAQDSGKTYTTKVVRGIVDPSRIQTRGLPESEEELRIQGLYNHVIVIDNASSISPDITDAICRMVYGEGYATRKLFTNSEEFVIGGAKPIIINGIPSFGERQDFSDRILSVQLKPINSENRLSLQELDKKLELYMPGILGDIFCCIQSALANELPYDLTRGVRMSDSAAWVEACLRDKNYKPGDFTRAWTESRQLAVADAASENYIVQLIKTLVMDSPNYFWKGTPTELLVKLEELVQTEFRKRNLLPKTAQKLSEYINRSLNLLSIEGISYEYTRAIKRFHTFTYVGK